MHHSLRPDTPFNRGTRMIFKLPRAPFLRQDPLDLQDLWIILLRRGGAHIVSELLFFQGTAAERNGQQISPL